MAALWSGQKPADMSGSTTSPSIHEEAQNKHQHTVSRTEAKRKVDIVFRPTWQHNKTAAPGLCVGGTFNQHNRAHCVAVTWTPACVICYNSVSVKMLGDSKLFRNKYQPLDFSFQLISIISDMKVQTETSLGSTLATKPSVSDNNDNDSLFCAGFRMNCSVCFFLRWCCWMRLLTFCKTGHWEWNTDDSYQVLYWYQRPKDGSDAYCFTFAGVD